MGFLVAIETEDGEQLDVIEDETNVLGRLLPTDADRFSLISGIDPYGDTVFNRLQMARFTNEWQYVIDSARSETERRIAARIKAFTDRVDSEPHLYLKFYGD